MDPDSSCQEKLLYQGSTHTESKTTKFFHSTETDPTLEPLKLLNDKTFENNTSEENENNMKFDGLTKLNIFGYGVGHFINDLAAAGWFNYLTIYLKSINPIDKFNPGFYAGLVLLSGQIADGVATPVIGYLSDKTNTRIGKRIPWYIAGLILVSICYIFIFQKCLFCEWFGTEDLKMFYYILFPSLFNVGWASLQIAHMSLVPSLSSSRIVRDNMNGLRNTFTYAANFSVLLIALIMFCVIDNPVSQFEAMSYIIVGFGIITSIFFLAQINEPKLTKECTECTKKIKHYLNVKQAEQNLENPSFHKKIEAVDENHMGELKLENENKVIPEYDEFEISKRNSVMRSVKASKSVKGSVIEQVPWTSWFKNIMFYQYGFVYMAVRLTCNITSSLFNFYLVYVIKITKADLNKETPKELAIVPLILYAFSVLGSLGLNKLYTKIGRKKTYILGALFIVASSIVMIFLDEDVNYLIYPVAIFNGLGQSLVLNTGIVLISEVIGLKGSSGAFVFGAYSFCDKVSSGLVLFFLLNAASFEENDPSFIRWATVLIPSISCFLAMFFIIFGKAKDYKQGENQGLEDEFVQ